MTSAPASAVLAASLGSGPQATLVPLESILQPGRIIELSGAARSARFTTAVRLVLAVQEKSPVVWIQPEGGTLFPPDLAEAGVELSTLTVIHVPASTPATSLRSGSSRPGPASVDLLSLARVAELVLGSGGFGLVVVDCTDSMPQISRVQRKGALQASQRVDRVMQRLLTHVRKHQNNLILISDQAADSSSLSSLISVRIEPVRTSHGGSGDLALVEHHILRNKMPEVLGNFSQMKASPFRHPRGA